MTKGGIAIVGRLLCLLGATLGAVGLFGWIAGARSLNTILPGQPPMMPNAAVALLLSGLTGALRCRQDMRRGRKLVCDLAGLLVLAIGVATLAEYLLGMELGIDQLLMHSEAGHYPGRMAPLTAIALVCLGSALLLLDIRPTARGRPSEWLSLSAGLIGLTALTGMLLGATPPYRVGSDFVGVAIPTAASLLLVCFGLLLERPTAGLMQIATARGPGGVLVRRVVLPTVLGPVLLATLMMPLLHALRIVNFPLAIAVIVLATTVIGLVLVVITAAHLNWADAALRASEAKLSALISVAPDAIISIDEDQRITLFNDSAEQMFGYSKSKVVGAPVGVLIPERFRAIYRQEVERFAANQGPPRRLERPSGVAIFGLRKNGEEFPPTRPSPSSRLAGNECSPSCSATSRRSSESNASRVSSRRSERSSLLRWTPQKR